MDLSGLHKKDMRKALADTLLQLAIDDERIILLVGDLGFGVFDEYKNVFSDRYINVGIAEAALVDIAAGLAMEGYRPVVYSIASFLTGRAFEQIRVAVNYQKLPVVLIGAGGGYTYAAAGPTHHAAEDLGLMSMLPGMTVTAPGSPEEISALLPQLVALDGPSYMRIGRYSEHDYWGSKIQLGKVRQLAPGQKIAIISTGDLAWNVCGATVELSKQHIYPEIYQMHTVKPLDEGLLDYLAYDLMNMIVVVEEHSPYGGLFSAIASYYTTQEHSSRLLRLGPPDKLVIGVHTREELHKEWGCDVDGIVRTVMTVCSAMGPVRGV